MVNVSDIGKRLLLGRKLRSTQLHETLLPKRIALPVFASDALSSVAYAPDEIFLTLSLAIRPAGATTRWLPSTSDPMLESPWRRRSLWTTS